MLTHFLCSTFERGREIEIEKETEMEKELEWKRRWVRKREAETPFHCSTPHISAKALRWGWSQKMTFQSVSAKRMARTQSLGLLSLPPRICIGKNHTLEVRAGPQAAALQCGLWVKGWLPTFWRICVISVKATRQENQIEVTWIGRDRVQFSLFAVNVVLYLGQR